MQSIDKYLFINTSLKIGLSNFLIPAGINTDWGFLIKSISGLLCFSCSIDLFKIWLWFSVNRLGSVGSLPLSISREGKKKRYMLSPVRRVTLCINLWGQGLLRAAKCDERCSNWVIRHLLLLTASNNTHSRDTEHTRKCQLISEDSYQTSGAESVVHCWFICLTWCPLVIIKKSNLLHENKGLSVLN